MRDAALEIALCCDDFAPSLFERGRRAAAGLLAGLRRARLARRHLKQLRRLDPRLLDDLGLTPTDLAALDPALSAEEATRRLAEVTCRRRAAEERWLRL